MFAAFFYRDSYYQGFFNPCPMTVKKLNAVSS